MSKLRFKVCFSSGEDPDFPAKELNIHSPHTKGWQSHRVSDYPQELGFAWESPARVTQVQILSHESKIATRIELFVGHGGCYESAQFRRLGYLSLNSNEESNYAARELKSVYVDAPGQYLRMLIHKCHINNINASNQVGIVAVNIIGEKLSPGALDAPQMRHGSGPRDHASYSPPMEDERREKRAQRSSFAGMNDLSFDMNFDPDIAQRIRDIAAAKERAVRAEDYDKAKLLKEAETRLKSLGQQLAHLYTAKRQAVEEEDYDRAKMLKMEADTLRSHMDAHQIDHFRGVSKKQQGDEAGSKNIAPVYGSFNAKPGGSYNESSSPGGRGGVNAQPHVGGDDRPITGSRRESNQAQGSPTVRHSSSEDEGSDIEDSGGGFDVDASPPKVKPRVLHSRQKALHPTQPRDDWGHEEGQQDGGTGDMFPPGDGDHPLEGVPNFEDLAVPETLSVKVNLSEVQGLNSLFGEYVTRCLYSKTWSLREAAIVKIKLMLPSLEEDPGINSALTEISQVLRIGFEDKIAQVFVTTLDLLESALLSIERCREARHNQVVTTLEPTVATLLGKLGDGQSRLRDGAMNGLMKVSRCRTVGPSFVSHVALKPLVKKQLSAWRPIMLRLNLLRQLVSEFGLEGGSDLTSRSIMGFVKSCNGFTHSNGEVRDAARELTVELQGIVGSEIEPFLTCLRPKQLDEYHEAFRVAGGEKGSRAGGTPSKRTTPRRPHTERSPGELDTSPKTARSVGTRQGNRGVSAGEHDDRSGSPVRRDKNRTQESPSRVTDYGDDDDFSAEGDKKQDDDFHDISDVEAHDGLFTCDFCGGSDVFTQRELDRHYWLDCPMLMGCSECSHVIEISCISRHLVDECEHRERFVECDISFLAVRVEELDTWQRSNSCKPPGKGGPHSTCPLCLEDIGSADDKDSWRAHLMNVCPRNPRR